MHQITLKINEESLSATVDERTSLLDLLREQLGHTGTKKGCDHGQCGACTVLLNGRRINSCLTLAVMHDGDSLTTVEGLATKDSNSAADSAADLSILQEAFIKHDALQCGYCTPGQLCSATAMFEEIRQGWPSQLTTNLEEVPRFTTDEVRERMSGNLCRCSCYPNIVAAIAETWEKEL